LIRAPVDDVITALADRTERWERDALGRDIVLGEQGGAFVFRLRGHSWTEAVLEPFGPIWSLPKQSLSRLLSTRMIHYSVSDTSGYIGYSLYENGELLEELSVLEGGSDEGPNTFSSGLRDLERDDITNVWDFTYEFLVDGMHSTPASTSHTSSVVGAETYQRVAGIASSTQALPL
jgi:hypothetical protein